MRQRDTLRFLFPALFLVMAIAALIAASVFQFRLLGTAGKESFTPAPVPSVLPSPSPAPVAVAVPSPPASAPASPAPAPSPSSAASPPPASPAASPTAAPTSQASPAAGGATALAPSPETAADIISPLPGVITVKPVDTFPFGTVMGIVIVLSLIFCAIWLLYSAQRPPVPAPAPA